MFYNPRYDKARLKGICDWSGPMCSVIKHTKDLGLDLPLPPRDTLKEACLS